MDSGAARRAQLTDPRKVRIMLGDRFIWSEVWNNNPRIAGPNETENVQIIYGRDPVTKMRPYHTSKTEHRWHYNLDFRPEPGELYFTDEEREFGARYPGRIIIEPTIKAGASPNKQWPSRNWRKFVELATDAGYALTQLGPHATRSLPGVELIVTPNFRQACAVLEHAQAYVGHEGGSHHAAAALGIPGVVIFGGFTPVELTGYPIHRNLGASLREACGMRLPCQHCADWMLSITPEQVFDALCGVLTPAS